MKKWRTRDMPPADPDQRAAQMAPRPTPPPPKTTPAGPPRTGFKAALRALRERKLGELLDTAKWRKRPQAEREAEAKARADREMARRIERQTGKKPAESTIRRNAAKNTAPRGADQERLDRQAIIDRAGGVKTFASQAKVSESTVRRWLAGKAVIIAPVAVTGPITIFFTVVCDLFHTSTDPKKGKRPSPQFDKTLKTTGRGGGWTGVNPLQLSGDEAADFLRLVADGDQQALKDKLGELLEMYELNGEAAEWGSAAIRCEVTQIVEIAVSE
jgi:hypothetical protein